ncbi:Fatty acid ABC transporter ATP-binding/permease protein [Apilactobacillus kunkeei]|uniref:Multidrug ABC transporter ATP-binding protein n=2 Tax=Apilactobacillus kunkeei TaxID=148814 RepID=A0AAC8WAU2_9LACO|nr:ABC transporter ATP-binding protein [Apilactobacillus kunkeei]ALJ30741.1 multidrug ABC transporter ATP-binding protein [Apilactobacillus kunkeei]KDB00684.1 ABC-type multidrug transport system, ATPase and permease component [Apilactobacillus kunkeei EFB6]KFJ14827.1 multidrug ABC transporter ATP-binding protein [Apilactobacillus kunkeei]KOY75241.1 ABC-type multidrug transport system, ATPase and permease component [Apilactobacillus kunkeei]CAI2580849.1 Fatty acid ABC transporter ATP-binding/pe
MHNHGKGKGAKAENFWSATWRLVKYVKPWMLGIIFTLIMAIAAVVLQIVTPKILGEATTEIYKGVMKAFVMKKQGLHVSSIPIDFTAVGHILITVASLYILAALFNVGQQFIMTYISQKVVYQLRKDLKAKLERLPISYYDTHSNGDIMSRMINDMDNISTMLQTNLTQFITSVLLFFGVLYMMLTISFSLTLVAICTLPLIGIIVGVVAPKSQRFFSKQQSHLGDVNSQVEENFAGHTIIKTFNREEEAIKQFEEQNDKYYSYAWKAQFVSSFMFPLMNFVKNLNYVFVAIFGGIKVAAGAVTLGNVQAFLQYVNMFNQPITNLANLTNTIQSTIASAERIFKVLDEPEMQDSDVKLAHEETNDKIKFEDVNFRYVEDTPLIKDFNLDVPKGTTVAIVGPTGAGKTTIINLLERFYDIDSGSIKLDGVDTREYSRSELRSHISMVLQDSWLFTGTIFDNIKYGNANATDEEVYQAAKEAQADEFIEKLPDGYDTVLNEAASNVSQGQRQLITIARAFLANPEILILDEATSSVDTRTESLIQDAMDRLIQGRTSFVVAHRLSTVQNAEKIIVMNHGQIKETGNHKSLMEQNGFYADLYNSQFIGNNL